MIKKMVLYGFCEIYELVVFGCQRIRLFWADSSRTANCATPGLQVGELHVEAPAGVVATLEIGKGAKCGAKRGNKVRD